MTIIITIIVVVGEVVELRSPAVMYTVVEFQPILHAIKTLRRTCWWAHGQTLSKARSSSYFVRRERNWSDLVARGASSSSMVQGGPVLRTLAGGSATGQVRTVTCTALRNGTRNSETRYLTNKWMLLLGAR